MISDKMSSALNDQINAELRSAYLYLAMSLEADSLTLRGVANWFYIQCQEEQDHARIFQKYLIDQDKQVELKSIPAFVTGWKSPVDMFREALAHEKEVTRMINELVELAYAEGDFATLERLQWFVREQVEEEASARDQITAFGRVEDNLEMLDYTDSKLLGRTYQPAEPLWK